MSKPREGTQVPDVGCCLCHLVGGAEVKVGVPTRMCELAPHFTPSDLGPPESKEVPEERKVAAIIHVRGVVGEVEVVARRVIRVQPAPLLFSRRS